ncbi:phage integrase family protein [Dysgonomonas alginatilytica]|uniref:Phage integrase family protein n=1 Tax=Dysgonomonas alginatilytica TaxID=1605892 RepID=A0A2V3PI40_9BACT|nr:phage integrase family protein [Dysgonomonas alginatilytica]
MKSKLKVLFYLKKNETKKSGLSAVMERIQVDRTMSQFSLKIKADAKIWDTKAGRMIGKTKLAQDINREINRINLIIHSRYKELKEIHLTVEAKHLKNVTQGIACSQATVLAHFRTMNETIALRVGIDYSQAASEQYINAYNALERLIHKKLNLSDIPFRALTCSHIEDYYQYLRVDRKLSIDTSGIYLVYFRKIVRNAFNQGIIYREPFCGFEPETMEVAHKSVTRQELDKFISSEPIVRQQRLSKDLFIFAAFTGLSYIDMKNLTYDEIKTAEDGSQWIIAKHQKTKVEYQVRLLDIPLAIIEKYRGESTDGKVFIVPYKMAMHRGLNAIAKRCGISKSVGIHMSRHTFASLITLSEGVPIETVSSMLGHKYTSTTPLLFIVPGRSKKIMSILPSLSSISFWASAMASTGLLATTGYAFLDISLNWWYAIRL